MRHNQCRNLISLQGFTLLEVLLAVSLSLLLLGALTRLYLSMKKTCEYQRMVNTHIDAANNVSAILSGELNIAGHIGCAQLSDQFRVEPWSGYSLTTDNYIVADAANLVVRYQQFPGVSLLSDTAGRGIMIADSSDRYARGQVLIISDCRHAEIFKVAGVEIKDDVQTLVADHVLRYQYERYAEIAPLVSHHYFVARSRQGDGFSLFMEDLNGDQVEIVNGVESFSFMPLGEGFEYAFTTMAAGARFTWRGYVASNGVGG